MELCLAAPAKVNLHLRVLARRSDGYHELITLMQPLDLADCLWVSDRAQGLSLSCPHPGLAGENNLVLKAARAFFAASGLKARARLRLQKRIPLAAGLGGGSSDAAAALLALNCLYGRPLAPARVAALAASLGADVPFFLAGSAALCSGIGQRVEPWPAFPSLNYLLVNPGLAVSTGWVYEQLDLTRAYPQSYDTMSYCSAGAKGLSGILYNDLERVTVEAHPVLARIKKLISGQDGVRGALMSGSGPTVFGVFDTAEAAEAAQQRLTGLGEGWWLRVCRGVGPKGYQEGGQHGGRHRSEGLPGR